MSSQWVATGQIPSGKAMTGPNRRIGRTEIITISKIMKASCLIRRPKKGDGRGGEGEIEGTPEVVSTERLKFQSGQGIPAKA